MRAEKENDALIFVTFYSEKNSLNVGIRLKVFFFLNKYIKYLTVVLTFLFLFVTLCFQCRFYDDKQS